MKLNQTIKHFALSSPQREIWFDQMLHPELPLYNIGGYIEINGTIDLALFESAVQLLVQSHDTLRTRLVLGTELPRQTFLKDMSVSMPFYDFSQETNPHQSALTWMQEQFVQPFQLEGKPLFRFALLKVSHNRFNFGFVYHHLIIDGWGISLINKRLGKIYSAFVQDQNSNISSDLKEPSYWHFVENDRSYIESERYEVDRQYWIKKYQTLPEPLFTPRYLNQFVDQIPPSERQVLWLPRPFYKRLQAFAKNTQSTLFHVMLGALYAYFTRTTQREELAIGLPVLNRSNAAFKKTVGSFIGVCASWFQFGTKLSFRQLLKAIGNALKSDYRHQRLPISELNRALGIQKMGRMQLFDIQLNYAKHDHDTEFGRFKAKTIALTNDNEQTPLSISIWEFHENEKVQVDFVYNLAYFNSAEIERIQSRFMMILEYVLTHVDESIRAIPLMTEAEQKQLLTWNQTETDFPKDQTIVDMFQAQVEKTPENIAVVFPSTSSGQDEDQPFDPAQDMQLSYRELNQKANQLAHYLLSLKSDTDNCQLSTGNCQLPTANWLIGICVERSLEMAVGLLGILKAGAAYVPLDPDYPDERLAFMIKDSGLRTLITQNKLQNKLHSIVNHELSIVNIESIINSQYPIVNLQSSIVPDTVVPPYRAGNPQSSPVQSFLPTGQAIVNPQNLAYVIYTSGSTGNPKGVMVKHAAITQHINYSIIRYQIESSDNVLQFASLNFDASIEQIFSTWCSGARLVLLSTNLLQPKTLEKIIHEEQITIADLPPVYWQQLLNGINKQSLETLKLLILGGDVLTSQLARQTRQFLSSDITLLNAYGPTEATITATLFEVTEQFQENSAENVTPIGSPVANTQIYILDANHNPIPPGIPGELCIAGSGLARGYLNRPELTAEKFIEIELFGKTQRIYKTGDLASWLPDGNLEFLGRLDHQVKLRGFRIELGEIEATLTQHEVVKEAVVELYNKDDNPRLVAYITVNSNQLSVISYQSSEDRGQGTEDRGQRTEDRDQALVDDEQTLPITDHRLLITDLRAWLKARLPEYMLPTSFTVLDKLPLTPNGKIDRKALPAPDFSIQAQEQAPQTETEHLLCSLWSQALGIEVTSINSHFFEEGGHSLLAIQLVSRIRESFSVEMPLRVVFEQALLKEQAEWLDKQQRGSELPPISPLAKSESLVLSFAQQRLWFLTQLEGQNATYNMPAALRLSGQLNETVLQSSLTDLIHRHESLRLCFPMVDGEATVQLSEVYNPLSITDLSELSETEQQRQVTEWISNHAQNPFDMSAGPLLSLRLLKLGKEEQILLFNMHHIISDGWSIGVLIREWSCLYNAYCQNRKAELPNLPIQYTDYAAWQRNWLSGEVLERQLAYWQDKLSGAPELLELPTDYPRPAVQQHRGSSITLQVPENLTDRLKQLSRQGNYTLFMTLLGAFNILLYRYSGQDDICIGTPVANRNHIQLEGLIGLFLSTVVLRTRIPAHTTFHQLMAQIRQTALDAFAHQETPFELLVEKLQPQRSLSRHPLFQVMFNLINIPETPELELIGIRTEHLQTSTDAIAKFDLNLAFTENSEGLIGRFEYDTALFTEETVRFLGECYLTLLQQIVAKPGAQLSQLSLLSDAWRSRIAKPQHPAPVNSFEPFERQIQSIPERFSLQVQRYPDRIAVRTPQSSMTYRELDQASRRLAAALLKRNNNRWVALLLPHDCSMVVGILGVLQAGRAYIPLDANHPLMRLQYIIEDTIENGRANTVVCDNRFQTLAEQLTDPDQIINLDILPENPADRLPAIDPDSIAYLLYTSGSTGRPKGVIQSHRNVLHFIRQYTNNLHINPDDRLLQLATYSFDAAVMDLFGALLNGASLYPVDLRKTSLTECIDWLEQQQVTIYHSTPSVYRGLISALKQPLEHVRLVVMGGENVIQTDVKNYRRYFKKHCLFINGLGPTESTVTAQYFLNQQKPVPRYRVPVGYPVAETNIILLNANDESSELYGEIVFRSPYLALGYWRRDSSTFRQCPGDKNKRLYHTGDIGRLLPNGALEVIGRRDHQVKLRGFRIELGEIEATLTQQENVKEAVVVLHDNDNDKRLAAYITLRNEKLGTERDETPTTDNLLLITKFRVWLKARLPDYMIPSHFTVLERLPLTHNGKIDRRALPAPDIEISTGTKPATPTEDLLAGLWAGVLKHKTIGRHDNFFELGGHSLLATQLIARIRESLQVELPLQAIFEHPELTNLAKAIESASSDMHLPPIAVQAADASKVLSFGQEWFWLLNQYDSQRSVHNMFYAWRLTGELDVAALQKAAYNLVERHQSLRLYFPQLDGNVTVEVLPAYDPLTIIDVSEASEIERVERLKNLRRDYGQQEFSLDTGPLFRLDVVKLTEQKHILLLNVHHIICDDWSMGVLLREWQTLYRAYHQQQIPVLPELPIQYTDYAIWQRTCLQGEVLQQQLDYWINQLHDAPELLKLPTDYPRPETQQNQGGIVGIEISKELSEKLTQFARQQGCTLHMVLFSSFILLLHRYSGQMDICVGLPLVMRHQYQTESQVGLFLNMIVLRTLMSGQDTFMDLLKQVRKNALDAYTHQDVPFEYLVKHLRPQRQTAYNPYFQVMFNLINTPDEEYFELPGLQIEPWINIDDEIGTSNLDIVFSLRESAEGIHGSVLFDKALYKTETMNYWVEGFIALLEQAVTQPEATLDQFTLSQNALPRYPLTSSQREIWFDQMLHENTPMYNIGGHAYIPGPVDPELFEQAANLLVQKHDTLATLLLKERDEDGLPLQVHADSLPIKVPLHDFSNQENPYEAAMSWMQARFVEPFELTEKPLFRYDLVKVSRDCYYWLMQYHHLIVDGYGIALLNRSLAEIYTQLSNGQVPNLDSPSYVNFIDNDRAYIKSDTFEKQRRYWLEKYPAAPEPLFSPRYRSQHTEPLIGSACEALYLPRDFYNRLNELAKQHKASLFHLLLGALYVYFTRTGQRDDFAIGLPVLNRSNTNFKQTAGLFTGVSPTLFNFGGNLCFDELLQKININLKANYRHQRFPVSEVNRVVGSGLERSQLFDITLSYESHDYNASFDGIDSHTNLFLHPWEQTPLTIYVRDFHVQADVKFDFVYNLAYFNTNDVKALQTRFVTLLEAVLEDSRAPIHTLPLMTKQEVQQLQAWNETETDYPKDQTIVDLFQAQVELAPDNIAVVFHSTNSGEDEDKPFDPAQGKQLSYQELNQKANQLANYLLSLKSDTDNCQLPTANCQLPTANCLIGICVERSLEMVIGLLGILKAGAAYLPLDPDYPDERLAFMIKDSGLRTLITQNKLQNKLHSIVNHELSIVNIESIINSPRYSRSSLQGRQYPIVPDTVVPPYRAGNHQSSIVNPKNLAYVIYTSGSTGKPKGVMVEHIGLTNLIHAQTKAFGITRKSRLLQFASFSFDASVSEIATTLTSGATLQLGVTDKFLPDEQFIKFINHQSITHVTLPPSFLAALPKEKCSTLETIVVAGEACSPELVTKWSKGRKFINAYGPTESTVCATLTECQANGKAPSIGKPIANTQIYILDADSNPTPPGIPGELCIAGVGLARGYLNRTELTKEKFIEIELFGKTQRIYKTGDLARWLSDGNLEYLGRLDHQVKLRGFRIELGEIEATLTQHEAVKEAVVVVHNKDDNPRLIAYVTLVRDQTSEDSNQLSVISYQSSVKNEELGNKRDETLRNEKLGTKKDETPLTDNLLLITELRAWLKACLPEYMLPTSFMVLDNLPLTPNGKIDRKALPATDFEAFTGTYEAPRTDTEQRLVEVWNQVLKQGMGIFDNFFERGGDSILSIQIVARARAKGMELNPRDLFKHQTIAELAQVVQPLTTKKVAVQDPITGNVPLMPIQQAFFARQPKEPWHFNQAILLAIPADINEVALQQALAMIIQHHDALRLRYRQTNDQWRQWHEAVSPNKLNPNELNELLPFHIEDLTHLSKDLQAQALRERSDFWQASLNLETGPLVRLVLFHLGSESRLLWCIHHLAVDGVSWRILLEDLHTAYHQALAGHSIQTICLPAKTSSFKAWAERLFKWKESESFVEQAGYWRELTKTSPLPIDNPTGSNRVVDNQHCTIHFTRDVTRRLLTEAPKAYRTQINDILLTALMLTLRDWTGKTRQLIDLESHGRADLFEEIDLSRTVGWFTSLHTLSLQLPTKTDMETDLGKALKTIKEQLRKVPHDGVGYGILRTLCRETLPQGQILFNYLGQFDQSVQESEFRFAGEGSGCAHSLQGEREHLIEINGHTEDGCLRLTWTYSGEQYQTRTIQKLADNYQQQLQRLIELCTNMSFGYTPSDFPLAALKQNQLDQLSESFGNNITDIYPLSPMQQGMLFHSLSAPKSGIYFEQLHCSLSGHLNIEAFRHAWQHLIDRHTILRTAFWHETDTPLQLVYKKAELSWQTLDWRELSEVERQQRLQRLLTTERNIGFELNKASLMRVQVIRETDFKSRLVWHHHHLLMDGWCLPILFTELFEAYSAFAAGQIPGLPPVRPYRDYIAWLNQQDQEIAKEYWKEQLKGFSAPTPLPMTMAIAKYNKGQADYQELTLTIEAKLTQELKHFSRQHRLTLNTIVQGAWAALLSRYSGERDVVFGITTSGRQVPVNGIDRMVGLFINTLPLRVHFENKENEENNDLINSLQTIQQNQQENNQYAYTSLADIQNWSEVPNGIAMFDTIVVFENYPVDEKLQDKQHTGSLQITDFQAIEYTNYPITLAVTPGQEFHFKLTYDGNRFQKESIQRMLSHLSRLLESMVAQPDQSWHQLQMLTDAEQQQLLDWNQTNADYPKDQTIVDLFQAQVEKTPDNIAVVFPSTNSAQDEDKPFDPAQGKQLSYQELNQKANQVAHYLLSLKSDTDNCSLITDNSLVGICMERSLEMVIGLLGILKAGGAYVPLDPGYPDERLAFMIKDSGMRTLITQNKLQNKLHSIVNHELSIVNIESIINSPRYSRSSLQGRQSSIVPGTVVPPYRAGNPQSSIVNPKNLAYVIYTSGSTGVPKGVMVEHRNVLAMLYGFEQVAQVRNPLRGISVCPFSFDLSVWEFFINLCFGGTLHIINLELLIRPINFVDYLISQQINCMYIPSTLLAQVANELEKVSVDITWQRLLVGVEPIKQGLMQRYRDLSPELNIINGYGPTETTICATFYPFIREDKSERRIPIGKPVQGYQIYLMDSNLQLSPIGVPGELCIAGAGLARGYLNRPELTKEKFIEIELFGQKQRIYKTGDLARWLPDGNLEYLGRLDHQVKVRGFRIELGEIEATMTQHKAVKEAVVVLHDNDDDKRLAAYVTVNSNQTSENRGQRTEDRGQKTEDRGQKTEDRGQKTEDRGQRTEDREQKTENRDQSSIEDEQILPITDNLLLITELRAWLKDRLPEYMLPTSFTVLDKLPLTPNGKIDRKALSQLSVNTDLSGGDFVEPRTGEEKLLADIWADVLGIGRVGIHNNFFDLGGHSLLLFKVQAKLSECFDRKISMADLFEHPTIHTLAQYFTLKQAKQTTQNRANNRIDRQTSMKRQREARQKRRSRN